VERQGQFNIILVHAGHVCDRLHDGVHFGVKFVDFGFHHEALVLGFCFDPCVVESGSHFGILVAVEQEQVDSVFFVEPVTALAEQFVDFRELQAKSLNVFVELAAHGSSPVGDVE
jgi:hypothetical protein